MKSLLELRIETVPSAGSGSRGQFKALARARGLEIHPIRLEGLKQGAPIPNEYWAQLREAAGYLIGNSALLADEETRKVVDEKLAKGAVAVCDVRAASFDNVPGGGFFEDLGIYATSVGAFAARYSKYGHPRLIQISRDEYPTAFRDSQLFRGVESLLLQQANGVGCSGFAQPALALPVEMLDVVDLRKDLFVDSFPKPELPVAAVSSRRGWTGQVIAFSATLFEDPYEGVTGQRFPCIDAEDNGVLAENVLAIVDRAARAAEDTWEDAYRFVRAIEGDLSRVTAMGMRSKYGEDWFTKGVPESIRTECEEMARKEGRKAPAPAYMSILNHKSVWKANWEVFGKVVSAGGEAVSKESGTKFFGRFNEIRRLAMHPTKQVFAERGAPSEDELRDLRNTRDIVMKLLARARALGDGKQSKEA